MAHIKINRPQFLRAMRGDTRRAHKVKRIADAICHIAVLSSAVAFSKTQRPTMHLMYIRIAAFGKRPQ